MTKRDSLLVAAGLVCGLALSAVAGARTEAAQSQPASPDEIAVLRYFRIKKGAFPEFYRASRDQVWPYYEKAGARIVGMWQVTYPNVPNQSRLESADYDEVYLLTRYTGIEHWQATRDAEIGKLGGDGPDLLSLREGLKTRANLGVRGGPDGQIVVLQGRPAFNGPYFPRPIERK